MPIYRTLDHNFFSKWNKEMAYVLGFFCADGYMIKNNRGACYIDIKITDKDLLHKIRSLLNSSHRIRVMSARGNDKEAYRIQIGSKKIYEDLINLGLETKKSKVLKLPSVPKKYFGDFVRGYFDGDGCIWGGIIHKKRKTKHFSVITSFTSCSGDFLSSLRKRLSDRKINSCMVKMKNSNAYRLQYSAKSTILLYDLMYGVIGEKSPFLERKKKDFENKLKNLRNNAVVA